MRFSTNLPTILAFAATPALNAIPASSKTASDLLSKARRLEDNQDEEEIVGWMVDYSLKFDSCHEIASLGGEGDEAEERDGATGGVGLQRWIKFRLCPNDACATNCKGGAEYLIGMREFVESYWEVKEEMEEKQNQNNNNNNNNNNNQGEDFDIDRFLECEPLNEGNNYNNYYTGAYCGDSGGAVYLGVFTDAACTARVDNSIFKSNMYYDLPYSSTSLIGSDCLSCDASEYEENDGNNNNNDDNNGNNQDDEDQVLELCQELHGASAKCEEKLDVDSYNTKSYYGNKYYPNAESCQFIHSTMSGLESITKTNGRSLRVARILALVFGIISLLLIAFIVCDKVRDCKKQRERKKVGGSNFSTRLIGGEKTKHDKSNMVGVEKKHDKSSGEKKQDKSSESTKGGIKKIFRGFSKK